MIIEIFGFILGWYIYDIIDSLKSENRDKKPDMVGSLNGEYYVSYD